MNCPNCKESGYLIQCDWEEGESGGGGGPVGEQRFAAEQSHRVRRPACGECGWTGEWECVDKDEDLEE